MSDNQVNEAPEFDPFDEITTETKPAEFPPYLGIIVRDEKVNSIFQGEPQTQFVYSVRPVDAHIGGKTGAWTGYVKWSTKANTTMMRLVPLFTATFGKINPETGAPFRFGKGDFVGQVAMFQNKSFDFGPKLSPGKPIPMPVGPATEEQIERARNLPAYVPQASADDSGTGETNPGLVFTEVELQAAVALYDTRTHKDVIKIVVGGKNSEDYPPHVLQGIQSGILLNELVAKGLVEKAEDGTVRALVTA